MLYLLLDEISACLKIDNQLVGQTPFKTCSQQCWDHRMSIDLDRARELEIAVYWKDYRYVSHVAWFGVGRERSPHPSPKTHRGSVPGYVRCRMICYSCVLTV